MANPAISRLLLLPVRRPVATLLCAAIVLALAAWSIANIRFDPRLEALLPGDADSAAALQRISADFHLLDTCVVLVETPGGGGDDPGAQDRRIQAMLDFAERFESRLRADGDFASTIEGVEHRVNPQFRRYIEEVVVPHAALYLSDTDLAGLLARLEPEAMRQQMARNDAMIAAGSPAAGRLAKELLRDPLRLHDIITPALARRFPRMRIDAGDGAMLLNDKRALLITITAKGPATDMDFTRRLMALLRRAEAAAAPGDLRISYGGAYPIAQFSEREVRATMIGTVTGSIILMQLLYLVAYRRIASFALIFLPVACGMAVGLGVYGLFFGEISPISAGIGAILAGLGDDFSIHYMSHYESCRRRGMSVEQAADITGGLGASMVHACGTSMIGFLTIAVSTAPALRDFAVLGALGLAGALVGVVTVLPAVLALLERFRGAGALAAPRFGPAVVERFSRKPARVLCAALLIIAAAAALVRWNASPWFETDLHAMHPQPNPPLQVQDYIATMTGSSTERLFVHVEAAGSDELLRRLWQTHAALLDEWPPTRETIFLANPSDYVVRGAWSPAALLPDPFTVDSRLARLRAVDRAAILAAFNDAVRSSLFDPAAFDSYAQFIDRLLKPASSPGFGAIAAYPAIARLMLPAADAAHPTQAIATLQLSRSPADQRERDRLVDALRAKLASVDGARLTGLGVVGRDMERAVRAELPRIGLIAGGFVFLWIALLFRRPALIMLALLPTLGAAAALLAVMRVTGSGLNMVNMAAIPILFGIAIDSGIFLVAARRDGDAHELADRCHAVTLSTLTTILGFGALMWASVPAIASLGLALAAGMVGCWVASVLIVAPPGARQNPPTGVGGL